MNQVDPNLPASIAPGQVTSETPSISVDASKLKAVAITLSLSLAATLGGATTILHFARDRDVAGIAAYVQSSDAVLFFGGVATLGGIGGAALRSFWRKGREIYLAYHAKDRIAFVRQNIEPPKPV